ncbi:hypothetical protein CVT26_012268 [Gymnopilus dilepis]|uniref:Uncharacterized protein n=1 Tax=Gymnopilus dilepis TaxID=231916 RepID=A0A409YQA8_9AGAR|nr:hypothetical protein CVT26_012268 [Gymnopilus dilepis]
MIAAAVFLSGLGWDAVRLRQQRGFLVVLWGDNRVDLINVEDVLFIKIYDQYVHYNDTNARQYVCTTDLDASAALVGVKARRSTLLRSIAFFLFSSINMSLSLWKFV